MAVGTECTSVSRRTDLARRGTNLKEASFHHCCSLPAMISLRQSCFCHVSSKTVFRLRSMRGLQACTCARRALQVYIYYHHRLCRLCISAGSPSRSKDVMVYVFDINQLACPLLFVLFLCLFLSLWPFQLYFIP